MVAHVCISSFIAWDSSFISYFSYNGYQLTTILSQPKKHIKNSYGHQTTVDVFDTIHTLEKIVIRRPLQIALFHYLLATLCCWHTLTYNNFDYKTFLSLSLTLKWLKLAFQSICKRLNTTKRRCDTKKIDYRHTSKYYKNIKWIKMRDSILLVLLPRLLN